MTNKVPQVLSPDQIVALRAQAPNGADLLSPQANSGAPLAVNTDGLKPSARGATKAKSGQAKKQADNLAQDDELEFTQSDVIDETLTQTVTDASNWRYSEDVLIAQAATGAEAGAVGAAEVVAAETAALLPVATLPLGAILGGAVVVGAAASGGGGGGTSGNTAPTGSVTLSGTPTQGQVLTAANTLADADGLGTITYKWQVSANGTSGWTDIVGATNSTLTLAQAQVGQYVRSVASYTDLQGTSESVASSASAVVVNINDAPTGTNATITLLEDGSKTFSAADFGFADAAGESNTLQAVIITTLPTAGTLTLGGVAVTLNQVIPAGSLGTLVYTPAANANGAAYANIGFKVQDNGGTANGGVDTSAAANTLTIDVTAVNDAPTGADATLTVAGGGSKTFSAADFGFADAAGESNTLQAVIITALPAAGTLTLSGAAVTANQSIAVADIGNLVFTPAAGGSGAGYASIGFKVQDNGGTANGGMDTSVTANTLNINVTPAHAVATLVVTDDVGTASQGTPYTAGNATGAVANNTSTDDTTPTISGTVNATLGVNEVVQVFDGNTLLGNATVTGLNWSYQTTAQSVGSHTYSAKVVDTVSGLSGVAQSSTALVSSLSPATMTVDTGAVVKAVEQVRYILVKQNGGTNTSLWVNEIEVYAGGINVALGKTATAGPYSTFPNYPVSGVTDGSLLRDGSHGYASNTATTDNWVQVDLGALYAVDSVNIKGLSSTEMSNIANVDIFASAQSMSSQTYAELTANATVTRLGGTGASPVYSTTANAPLSPLNVTVSDDTPTLGGTLGAALGANEQVKVYVDGVAQTGTATVTGMGWTYTLQTQSVGSHTVKVQVEDVGGTVKFAQSQNLNVVSAAAPTTTVSTLVVTDDVGTSAAYATGNQTGAIANGRSTDDTTPTLGGTLSAALGTGEVVQVFDGNVLMGNATVTGTNWSYQTTAQTLGSHAYSAKVVNTASGLSSAAQSSTAVVGSLDATAITVDTGTVAQTGVRYILVKQTGASLAGLYVNEVEVYVDGVNVALGKSVTVGGSNHAGYNPSGVTDGNYNRGNGYASNQNTNSNWVQVDLGAEYAVDSVTVKALSSTDLANIVNVDIFGSTHGMSSQTYAQLTADTTVTRLGGTGASPVYSTAFDASLAPFNAVIDTTPTLSGTLGAALGTNEQVKVYVDGVAQAGTATVTGTGWTYTLPIQTVGSHTVKVQVEDATSNAVKFAQSQTIKVSGTSAPTATVSTMVVTDDAGTGSAGTLYTTGNATGTVATGTSTDDTTPTLGGTLSAALGTGEVVQVFDGSTLLGNATVSGTSWSYQTAAQSVGSHAYSAKVVNAASGLSTAAQSSTAVVGSLSPATITVDTGSVVSAGVRYILVKQTGASYAGLYVNEIEVYVNGVNIALGKSVTVGGTNYGGFEPSEVTDGNLARENGFASNQNTNNNWVQVDLGAEYAVGSVTVKALSATDLANIVNVDIFASTQSMSSQTYAQLTADATVTRLGGTGASPGYSTSLNTTTTWSVSVADDTPTLTGTLGAALGTNEQLKVYVDGVAQTGTATVTGTGWTYTLPTQTVGSHTVKVQVEDATSNAVKFAQSQTINVTSAVAPTTTVSTLVVSDDAGTSSGAYTTGNATGTVATGTSTDDTTPTLGGTLSAALTAGQVVQVFDGATLLGNATVAGTNWSYQTTAQTVGSHVYSAKVVNLTSGLASAAQSSTVVVNSLSVPTVTVDTGVVAQNGVRYILVKQNGATTNQLFLGGVEVLVDGVNIALGKVATAGRAAEAGFFISNVTDGSVVSSSGYVSYTATNDNWVQVDLGAVYAVNSVTVKARAGYTANVANLEVFAGTQSLSGQTYSQLLADTTVARLGGTGSTPATTTSVAAVAAQTAAGINTIDDTPTLSGTLGVALGTNEQVKVYVDGVAQTGTATVSGTGWSYTLPTQTVGSHTVKVQVEDATTGAVKFAQSVPFTLQAGTAPTTTVSTLVVTDDVGVGSTSTGAVYAAGNATGAVATGTSTDDNTPTLGGNLSAALTAGQVVQVFDGATLLGNAAVSGTTWSFQTTSQSVGSHAYSAKVVDTASGLASAAQSSTAIVNSLSPIAVTVDTGAVSSNMVRYVLVKQNGTVAATLFLNEMEVYVGGVNVALGKAVTVGPSVSYSAAYPATGVTDGILARNDGHGYSNFSVASDSWVQVDLGALYAVDSITLKALSGADLPQISNVDVFAAAQSISSQTYSQLLANTTVTRWGGTGTSPAYSTTFTAPVSGAEVSVIDTTPTLSGTLGAALGTNEQVKVYVDGVAQAGTATVTGTGWTYTLPTQTVGSHTVKVQVEDVGGTVKFAQSQVLNVASTAAPNKTVTSLVVSDDVGTGTAYAAGNQTGAIATGGSTDDTTPTLSGGLSAVLDAGEVVQVFDGATLLGTATVTGTNWTYQTTAQTVGSHTYSAKVVNAASGLASTAQSSTAVVNSLGWTSIGDNAGAVQGNVLQAGAVQSTAVATDDTTPTLGGSLGAALGSNERVAVYVDGVFNGAASVNGLAWSYTPTTALSVASHTVDVRLEDATSFASKMVLSQGVTIVGASAPTTVVGSIVVTDAANRLSAGDATGTVGNNASTNDTAPVISGGLSAYLQAGEVVHVFDGATLLGNATVTGATWSYTPSTNLALGSHTLSAKVTQTGNGLSSTAVTTVVNEQALSSVSVTPTGGSADAGGVRYVMVRRAPGSADLFSLSDIAVYGNGGENLAKGKTVTSNLSAAAGSPLSNVTDDKGDASYFSSASATTDGWVQIDLGAVYNVTSVKLSPQSGNYSTMSGSYVFMSATSMAASALATLQAGTGGVVNLGQTLVTTRDDTSGVEQLLVFNYAAPAVSTTATGAALAGTLATALNPATEVLGVYVDGVRTGSATMSGLNWSANVSGLSVGEHTVKVQVEDTNTGAVHLAQSRTFNVVAAAAPTTTASIINAADDVSVSAHTSSSAIGAVASGRSTDDTTPTLAGTLSATLKAGEVVQVFDGATLLGTATVSGTSWTFAAGTTTPLSVGSHALTAKVVNLANGTSGTASAAYTLNVESLGAMTLSVDSGSSPAITARYVMVRMPYNSQYVDIYELEVWSGGTNVALGKTTAVAGNNFYYPSYDAMQATDGIKNTLDTNRTHSVGLGDLGRTLHPWVQIDLGANVAIDRVSLLSYYLTGSDVIVSKQDMRGTDLSQLLAGAGGAVVLGVTSANTRQEQSFSASTVTDTTPTVSGTLGTALGSGEQVGIYVDGVYSGNATVSGTGSNTAWTYTLPTQGTGKHTVVAQVEDAAHKAILSQSMDITITAAATQNVNNFAAALTSAAPGQAQVQGVLSAGLVVGQKVGVYDGANLLGYASLDAGGLGWSYTASGLGNGAHALSAKVLNADGSVGSGTAGTGTVTVTAASPTQVLSVISAVESAGAFDMAAAAIHQVSPSCAGLWVTSDTTPSFYGTLSSALNSGATTGETIKVYDNGVEVVGASVTLNGLSWSYTASALSEGQHAFTFRVANGANVGTASAAYTVEVDAVVSNTATITSVTDNTGALSGTLASGDTSDDAQWLIGGKLATVQYGRVELYDNGSKIATIDVLGTDSWSYATDPLSSGAHALTAKFVNTAGVAGAASSAFTVTVASQDGILTPVTTGSVDAVALTNSGQTLDFTQFTAGVKSIDKVDLGTFGGNVVKVTAADVLEANTGLFTTGFTFSNAQDGTNASTYHQMLLTGSGSALKGASTVQLAEAANVSNTSPWVLTGTALNGTDIYNVYTNLATNNEQLLINQKLAVLNVVL